MANFTLTAGVDTVAGGATDDTVYATSATLNAGDSLTGGAGTDVLALVGSGTFRVDQLATFTGFERITLDNATNYSANLTLGSQPIEVDATGYLSIQVSSPSNWNGSDIINGDASHTWTTTSIGFSNNQGVYPPLPVTYDLTSNTFSHVSIYGGADNITLLINKADTAGVQSFAAGGMGDKLVTAGSTLDLSHTTVGGGFTVASTNALGTAFTVGDLGTAFQVAGGSGHDTLIAQGLTLTAAQRTEIFATNSIETITDQTGTYAAPAPSPGVVGLTPGNDTFVAPSSGSTVYATSATLNAGDSLTGGAGTDVLALVGSGTFRVDQLATFTGFERITLDNATNYSANLTLGSQPIEVDATGYLSIQVSSPSNWNGSDIINGDASHTWTTTSIGFSNNQGVYPPLPVTYDLTSNTFSHVNIYGGADNITLLINNADTAGVQSFAAGGMGDKLVTAGSTLDLSHTTVGGGFTVASTNALGTAFTVGDLGTAEQIAGGPGHDTIVAQGFAFTADQRNSIFATNSIETITDQTGTYAAPAPSPGIVGLTPGNDAFVAPPSGSTVYATSATLSAGDSLTGGAGTDVLALVGGGTFRVDQLATFTGFERITLDNAANNGASLTLGSQPIEVDVTGFLSIQVNSPSNWNGSDIINGDASYTFPATTIDFSMVYSPLPVTYDLTSNTFSHLSVYSGADNITLLINNADTAGVQFFGTPGSGGKLVTAGSTLDLSHTTVSRLTIASTNALGTTFTVGDPGIADQIAGGPGYDTIVAQGFTFAAYQRNNIFATNSIEKIVDQTGTYTSDKVPTITGAVAGQATDDQSAISPFAGVTIGDVDNPAQSETLTVTLDNAAKGSLSNLGGGSYDAGSGVYSIVGTAAQVTAALEGLVFTPTANHVSPGASETTTFTIVVDDGLAPAVIDAGTTVVSTSVNDAPTIRGTAAGQTTNDHSTITPFAGVTIGDVDNPAQSETLTVTLDNAAKGSLSNLGGGSYDAGSGVYSIAGTAAQVTAALDGLVFTPTANHVPPGTTETTTFTIAVGDGLAPAVTDAGTTVVSTSVNDAPTIRGTAAGQTTNDHSTITPFAGVTIGDVDRPAQSETLTVTLDNAAKGSLSNLGGGSYDAGSGVYSIVGTAAQVTAALDGLVFTPTANHMSPGASETTTFTIAVDDGLAPAVTDAGTTVVSTSVNDAPTIRGTGAATFTGGDAAVALDPTLTVSDPDSATMASATVSIGNGFLSGDTLDFTNQNGISASYDAVHGVLTLTGASSVAHYQAALDSVSYRFSPASGDPTGGSGDTSRTIHWAVSDGVADSNTASSTLHTVHVAPKVTAGATATFTGGGNAVALDPSLTISDPDSGGMLTGATVTVTGGTFPGDGDVLSASTTGTHIAATYNAATEMLTLTGTDTIAHYQSVLDAVTFTSASDPTNSGADLTRTVTWVVNDGNSSNGLSAPATSTVGLTKAPAPPPNPNGDYKANILWQNDDGHVWQSLMNGGSVVGSNDLGNAGNPTWHVVSTGDFNGDGRSDMLWQNNDGHVWETQLNGGQVINSFDLGNADNLAWHLVATGDFNGDGRSDILWQNDDGHVWESLMNGGQVISSLDLGNAGNPAWHVVSTGDFNGDGRSDILWQNDDGHVWESLMNGGQVINSLDLGNAGNPAWHVVSTGDFNGDGRSDILWQKDDGHVWESLMNGGQVIGSNDLGNAANPAWHVVATGDFNGDGRSDILWQKDDGHVWQSLMNGGQVIGSNDLGNAANPAWHILAAHA